MEVCINNAWGTVCDKEFSSQDVEVVCRQIGELPSGKCRCYSHSVNQADLPVLPVPAAANSC